MKRIIFLLCAFVAALPFSNAQSDSENAGFFNDWQLGARVGINVSNMFGDVGNNSFLFSVNAGVVGNKSLTDKLGLAVEPHFSIEGQKLNGGYDRITYFNIPILVRYQVSDNFSAEGGLKMGIKVIEKTKFGTTGNTLRRNRFKTLAPGIVIGTTYNINENWFAQFRYNIKLKDVVRVGGGDSEGSIIMLFQFCAGYLFGG
ncbi:MAG: porin family protein [Bacteroidota bacterium]